MAVYSGGLRGSVLLENVIVEDSVIAVSIPTPTHAHPTTDRQSRHHHPPHYPPSPQAPNTPPPAPHQLLAIDTPHYKVTDVVRVLVARHFPSRAGRASSHHHLCLSGLCSAPATNGPEVTDHRTAKPTRNHHGFSLVGPAANQTKSRVLCSRRRHGTTRKARWLLRSRWYLGSQCTSPMVSTSLSFPAWGTSPTELAATLSSN